MTSMCGIAGDSSCSAMSLLGDTCFKPEGHSDAHIAFGPGSRVYHFEEPDISDIRYIDIEEYMTSKFPDWRNMSEGHKNTILEGVIESLSRKENRCREELEELRQEKHRVQAELADANRLCQEVKGLQEGDSCTR